MVNKRCVFAFDLNIWNSLCHHTTVDMLQDHGVDLTDVFYEAFMIASMITDYIDISIFSTYITIDPLEEIIAVMPASSTVTLNELTDGYLTTCYTAFCFIRTTAQMAFAELHAAEDSFEFGILPYDPLLTISGSSMFFYLSIEAS